MLQADELALLRASLRDLLADGEGLDALAELGWDDVVAADPAAATSMLFEEHGAALAVSPALDAVAAAVLGGQVTMGWPAPGCDDVIQHGQVHALVLREGADSIVVPSGAGLLRVAVSALHGVDASPLDPALGWRLLTGPLADVSPVDGEWASVRTAARRALASELCGIAGRILAVAVTHVTDREQFGRAIGSYQSVRHRLAETYASIVGAEALVAASWTTAPEESAWAAATAKSASGEAHATASRHAMQVCGGMGLSFEHELPGLVRRGYALDALLGSARELTMEQGQALLDGAPVLAIAPL